LTLKTQTEVKEHRFYCCATFCSHSSVWA